MGIVETERRFEGAFDELQCPVCGSEKWTHLVFQGVFCRACNTRCLLREPGGDQGFIATFDSKYTWLTDDAEPIPESDEHGAVASGKWLGSPRRGYDLYWFSVKAEYPDDDVEWKPAWERETGPTYLIDLPAAKESAAHARANGGDD
jgi:hypothetical protein